MVEGNRPQKLGAELSLFDLHGNFPHNVAGDKAADEQLAKIVEDEVALGEPANDAGSGGSLCPYQGHGDGGHQVGEDPDESTCAISEAVLKVDAEDGFPFPDGSDHPKRILWEFANLFVLSGMSMLVGV